MMALRRRHTGFTLMEMVVAMSILLIFMGMTVTSTVAFSNAMIEAKTRAEIASDESEALARLSQSYSTASSTNTPGTSTDGNVYVEWLTPVSVTWPSGKSSTNADATGGTCTQLKYSPNSESIMIRTWADGTVPTDTWTALTRYPVVSTSYGDSSDPSPFKLVSHDDTDTYKSTASYATDVLYIGWGEQAYSTTINANRELVSRGRSSLSTYTTSASTTPVCMSVGDVRG